MRTHSERDLQLRFIRVLRSWAHGELVREVNGLEQVDERRVQLELQARVVPVEVKLDRA